MISQDHGGHTELRNSELSDNLVEQSDEQLLENYKTRSCTKSYNTIYERYHKHIHNYLLRYSTDAAALEDAIQHSFLELHARTLEPGTRVQGWLFKVAVNHVLMHLRSSEQHNIRFTDLDAASNGDEGDSSVGRRASLQFVDDAASTSQEILLEGDRRERVLAALNTLDPAERQMIRAIYFDKMKYKEAAQVLGVPVNTLKSKVFRAFDRLRLVMDEGDAVSAVA
jgi:RNA polymerase sigma-70 factor (ECF subfamily)